MNREMPCFLISEMGEVTMSRNESRGSVFNPNWTVGSSRGLLKEITALSSFCCCCFVLFAEGRGGTRFLKGSRNYSNRSGQVSGNNNGSGSQEMLGKGTRQKLAQPLRDDIWGSI